MFDFVWSIPLAEKPTIRTVLTDGVVVLVLQWNFLLYYTLHQMYVQSGSTQVVCYSDDCHLINRGHVNGVFLFYCTSIHSCSHYLQEVWTNYNWSFPIIPVHLKKTNKLLFYSLIRKQLNAIDENYNELIRSIHYMHSHASLRYASVWTGFFKKN